MNRRALATTAAATTVAAVAGNAFVDRDDLAWLAGLRHTRRQLPIPAFAVVGALYYVIMGVVLYRATDRRDRRATRLALVVLALNELWNVAFFGRRSVTAAFVGLLVFLLPLGALQIAVRRDPASAALLAPYTAWVIAYDAPWTYDLWRRNRASAALGARTS